jgi:hypothetical protein
LGNFREDYTPLPRARERKKFSVGIAGVGLSFFFDQDLPELGLEGINDIFIKEMGDDIKLKVHHGHVPELRIKEKVFDSDTTWALYLSEGKYVLQNDTLEPGSSPTLFVVLEPDFKSGDIYLSDDSFDRDLFPDPLGYPLNQILMILLLARGKGIVFHACGVDDGGAGYLFLGLSGHGKSTMAKLWFENQAIVLNDDRIVVREKDGEFWMYGTPWHGDFRELSPNGLPIQKMFFLHRGVENRVVLKNGAEAVAMLLARSFPPLWDKNGMTYTTQLCQRIVNKIPCYELSFAPDTKIVDFVRSM